LHDPEDGVLSDEWARQFEKAFLHLEEAGHDDATLKFEPSAASVDLRDGYYQSALRGDFAAVR
jgi:hypothetical protein